MNSPASERSRNTSRWPIWLLVALSLAGVVGSIWLDIRGCGSFYGDTLGFHLAGYGFLFLGILVVRRHSENRIGWLAALIGFQIVGLLPFLSTYAECGQTLALPGVPYAAWFNNFIPPFFLISLFVLLPHLFPNGHTLTWRWKFAAWLGCGTATLIHLLIGLLPGPMVFSLFDQPESPQINPFGLSCLPAMRLGPASAAFEYSVLVASVLIAIASLVMRWRRSRGDERQQIKWFVVFLGAVVSIYLVLFELVLPTYLKPSLSAQGREIYAVIYEDVVISIVFMGFPVTLGITIFKYRLYDIDIIIRRTLSYAILTGILAAIYFGAVVLLQSIFQVLVGQSDSPLITVLSTLAIAALFNPLRHRVQEFIDRRFYRRKYDAEQALAQFAASARNEVDMTRLVGVLLVTVDETMQPERLDLWLQEPGAQN
jgi:hypothetical protein